MKAALGRETPEQPDVIFLFLCLPEVNFVVQQICTMELGGRLKMWKKGKGGTETGGESVEIPNRGCAKSFLQFTPCSIKFPG